MKSVPVFQMIVTLDENQERGVQFSVEIEGFAAPVFMIPIRVDSRRAHNLFSTDYYFPGELEGTYHEFLLKYDSNFGKFIIQESWMEKPLLFSLDFPSNIVWAHSNYNELSFMPKHNLIYEYTGKYRNLIKPFSNFVILKNQNSLLLNKYFDDKKMCLVGLTPVYGEKNNFQETNR